MVPRVDTVVGAFHAVHGMLPTAWRCALEGLGGAADLDSEVMVGPVPNSQITQLVGE